MDTLTKWTNSLGETFILPDSNKLPIRTVYYYEIILNKFDGYETITLVAEDIIIGSNLEYFDLEINNWTETGDNPASALVLLNKYFLEHGFPKEGFRINNIIE